MKHIWKIVTWIVLGELAIWSWVGYQVNHKEDIWRHNQCIKLVDTIAISTWGLTGPIALVGWFIEGMEHFPNPVIFCPKSKGIV